MSSHEVFVMGYWSFSCNVSSLNSNNREHRFFLPGKRYDMFICGSCHDQPLKSKFVITIYQLKQLEGINQMLNIAIYAWQSNILIVNNYIEHNKIKNIIQLTKKVVSRVCVP